MPGTYRINWLFKTAQRAFSYRNQILKDKGSEDVTAVRFGRLCTCLVSLLPALGQRKVGGFTCHGAVLFPVLLQQSCDYAGWFCLALSEGEIPQPLLH